MGRPETAQISAGVPVLLGVRLDQYAGVTAALAEGLSLREVLGQEQIDEVAWAPADRAWKETLVEATDLHVQYLGLRRRAEDCLSRPVEPLDSDVAAWAGLLGALATSDAPERVITGLGLRMVDVGRLGRAWRARAEKDPGVVDRLTRLAGKAQPPTSLRCGATVLRPFPWTPPPRREAPRAPEKPAPSEPLPLAPAAAPTPLPALAPTAPPLVVPFDVQAPAPPPLRVAPPALGETLGASAAPSSPTLPFGEQPSSAFLEEVVAGPETTGVVQSGETLGVGPGGLKVGEVLPFGARALAPEAGATGSAKTLALGETLAIGAGSPTAPALPFDMAGKPEEPYGLTLQQYASLWAELAVYPERVGVVLARYGLPDEDARKKLNEAWGRRFLKDPPMRRTWMDLCARYRDWLRTQGSARG